MFKKVEWLAVNAVVLGIGALALVLLLRPRAQSQEPHRNWLDEIVGPFDYAELPLRDLARRLEEHGFHFRNRRRLPSTRVRYRVPGPTTRRRALLLLEQATGMQVDCPMCGTGGHLYPLHLTLVPEGEANVSIRLDPK